MGELPEAACATPRTVAGRVAVTAVIPAMTTKHTQ
jgi:hypothetical protein